MRLTPAQQKALDSCLSDLSPGIGQTEFTEEEITYVMSTALYRQRLFTVTFGQTWVQACQTATEGFKRLADAMSRADADSRT